MSKYSNKKIAAAKSGMSERSANKYLKTKAALPSELKKERNWRTRPDVFGLVWEQIEQMMILSPRLAASGL